MKKLMKVRWLYDLVDLLLEKAIEQQKPKSNKFGKPQSHSYLKPKMYEYSEVANTSVKLPTSR